MLPAIATMEVSTANGGGGSNILVDNRRLIDHSQLYNQRYNPKGDGANEGDDEVKMRIPNIGYASPASELMVVCLRTKAGWMRWQESSHKYRPWMRNLNVLNLHHFRDCFKKQEAIESIHHIQTNDQPVELFRTKSPWIRTHIIAKQFIGGLNLRVGREETCDNTRAEKNTFFNAYWNTQECRVVFALKHVSAHSYYLH